MMGVMTGFRVDVLVEEEEEEEEDFHAVMVMAIKYISMMMLGGIIIDLM